MMKRFGLLPMVATILLTIAPELIRAQEVDFSIGGDLVSSYVWRGTLLSSASIQPSMGVKAAGFSLSAWGSVDATGGEFGNYKEIDFTGAYTIGGLTLAVTDYWCSSEKTYRYYHYDAHATQHVFEGTLDYVLPIEKFPVRFSWNTMFAGADYYSKDGDRSYSTYISTSFPFSIKDIGLELSLGLTPWEGMYADDFSVVSIGLKASKEIKISDSFSLPVFGQLITNPRKEDMYFVFGLSL